MSYQLVHLYFLLFLQLYSEQKVPLVNHLYILPSAKLILPTLNTETILISIFGLISVASAFWYKNKKSKKPQKSEEVKSVLSDIKKEIERDNPEKNQTGKNNKNEDEDNPIFYAR
jgi:hypothetical protein